MPSARREPSDAVRKMLEITHSNSAKAPLRHPTKDGVFPHAILTRPLCAVVDTHWLGFDVNYACAKNQRNVLITAANQQLIRLFCAQHVVEEIIEHVERWSVNARRSVSIEDFLRRWHDEYLPALRVVPDNAIPDSWLSPDELTRLDTLALVDTDDIPSVKLALAICGLYISKDGPAVTAVYGADAEMIDREKWLDHLRAGSDAGELARMVHGANMFGGLTGYGAFKAVQKTYEVIGPLALLTAGGVAYIAWDWIKHPARAGLRSTLSDTLMLVIEMEMQRSAQQEIFDKGLPQIPSWHALAETTDHESVTGRAALYTLARESTTHVSARELTTKLPHLLSCTETTVRRVLRSTPCFTEVYRGRWQIGSNGQLTEPRTWIEE
jgi:predicted nucleic acid-binding protein